MSQKLHCVLINRRNINNIRYADDTVLITKAENIFNVFLIKLQKKPVPGVVINCKENVYDETVKE